MINKYIASYSIIIVPSPSRYIYSLRVFNVVLRAKNKCINFVITILTICYFFISLYHLIKC